MIYILSILPVILRLIRPKNRCGLPNCTRARVLVAGFDYSFGSDKKVASDLETYFKGQVIVVPPVLDQGEKISSTRIRQAIASGQVKEAADLLGYPLSVVEL